MFEQKTYLTPAEKHMLVKVGMKKLMFSTHTQFVYTDTRYLGTVPYILIMKNVLNPKAKILKTGLVEMRSPKSLKQWSS